MTARRSSPIDGHPRGRVRATSSPSSIADARRRRRARRSPTATASSSPRRSCRRPRAASSRSTPTTSTPGVRSSSRSRSACCAGAATSSSARPGTASCARTPASTSRTSTTGTAALLPVDSDRSAQHVRDALRARPASRSRSSSPTRSGGRGGIGLTDVAIGVCGHRRGRRPARAARRAGPRAAGDRGRDRRRDRVRGRARDGQGGGRPRGDRPRARPDLVRATARAATSSARRPRTCSGDDVRSVVPFRRSSRRGARSARSPTNRSRAPILDALVEAACLAPGAAPLAAVALGRRRHARRASRRSPTAWARGGGATSTATASTPSAIDELVDASHAKLTGAPALVLGCLTWDGLDRYPDAARQRAEWGMALLSLGAAVENLMLAATDAGLASCWVAAPIFCPEAARDALALADEWLPHALVLVGHPDADLRRRASAPGPARRAPGARPPSAVHAAGDRVSGGRRGGAEVLEGAAEAVVEVGPRLPAEVDRRRGPGRATSGGAPRRAAGRTAPVPRAR